LERVDDTLVVAELVGGVGSKYLYVGDNQSQRVDLNSSNVILVEDKNE